MAAFETRRFSASSAPGRRDGFTLVEALLASTVLAIVAVSALLPFAAGIQQSKEATKLSQAVELGQALMEEVLARPFLASAESVPAMGPESGELTRTLFDSANDFQGYAESDGVLRDFNNVPLTDPSLAGFWRSVTLQYVTLPNQDPNDVNSLIHVQVNVYYDTALMVTLDRVVSREN
ncbi:MAG: prepilin-type N-terminal cleavage/methylation domain-containing protein [Phycisphaerae bacterium]